MADMTIVEMCDYVKFVDADGITLTESGRNAAHMILTMRKEWSDSHRIMLNRIESGEVVLPHKLRRLVIRTRLGDALDLARNLARKHIKNQRARARRKAARARRAAA